MRHIRIYWYINTNTNSPTPHTHSQILRHICTPVFISLYVENTSSYWYLQFLFNTIIPQGHSSFLTFHICDLLSNSEKPVPTILICLLIWSLPVLANFLPLLPFLPLYWNQSHPAWARRPYTMPLPLSPTWWKPLLPCSWSGTCTKPSPVWILSSLCWGSGTHHGVIPLCGPQALNPHSRLILIWGSTHTAWALTFHTGCPSWGYPPCPARVLTPVLEPWGLLLPWHGCLLVLPKRKRYPLLLLQFYIEKGKLGSIDFISSN